MLNIVEFSVMFSVIFIFSTLITTLNSTLDTLELNVDYIGNQMFYSVDSQYLLTQLFWAQILVPVQLDCSDRKKKIGSL